jgi:hypothetical protein
MRARPEATLSGTLSLSGSDFAAAPEQRAVEIVGAALRSAR